MRIPRFLKASMPLKAYDAELIRQVMRQIKAMCKHCPFSFLRMNMVLGGRAYTYFIYNNNFYFDDKNLLQVKLESTNVTNGPAKLSISSTLLDPVPNLHKECYKFNGKPIDSFELENYELIFRNMSMYQAEYDRAVAEKIKLYRKN